MNRNQILDYIREPTLLHPASVDDLAGLISRYPYFQGAYVLLARVFKQNNDLRFDEALKDAAVHSPDRIRLYEVLHLNENEKSNTNFQKFPEAEPLGQSEAPPVMIPEPKTPKDIRLEPVDPEPLLTDQTWPPSSEQDLISEILHYPEIDKGIFEDTEKESLSPQGELQYSFFEWLQKISASIPIEQGRKTSGQEPEREASKKSRHELIEQFILAEPKISRPVKTEFFSPVSMAKKSVEDRHDIVTETLARVFENQGNTDKAIQIYKKLSLQYPAKSRYFAALIEKLENQT
jgi:hypothetical protein